MEAKKSGPKERCSFPPIFGHSKSAEEGSLYSCLTKILHIVQFMPFWIILGGFQEGGLYHTWLNKIIDWHYPRSISGRLKLTGLPILPFYETIIYFKGLVNREAVKVM
jgi:hypothetical protein